jgi:hypothetical protein
MDQDKPESPLNIGLVCPTHAPKPGKYTGQDPTSFLKKFVKLGFPSPQGVEHMWVRVERLGTQGTELEGVLDNDPVYDVGFVCGDDIGFDVAEIEEVE